MFEQLYDVAYVCTLLPINFVVHLFSTFWFIEKIEKMAQMKVDLNYFDLIDLVDTVSISSIVYLEYYIVGVSRHTSGGWILSTGIVFFSLM